MSSLKQQLVQAGEQIEALEEERRRIYEDSQVDEREHPRLGELNHELAQLWDLKRRLEAAIGAGLDVLPVPPPANPEDQVG